MDNTEISKLEAAVKQAEDELLGGTTTDDADSFYDAQREVEGYELEPADYFGMEDW